MLYSATLKSSVGPEHLQYFCQVMKGLTLTINARLLSSNAQIRKDF